MKISIRYDIALDETILSIGSYRTAISNEEYTELVISMRDELCRLNVISEPKSIHKNEGIVVRTFRRLLNGFIEATN